MTLWEDNNYVEFILLSFEQADARQNARFVAWQSLPKKIPLKRRTKLSETTQRKCFQLTPATSSPFKLTLRSDSLSKNSNVCPIQKMLWFRIKPNKYRPCTKIQVTNHIKFHQYPICWDFKLTVNYRKFALYVFMSRPYNPAARILHNNV